MTTAQITAPRPAHVGRGARSLEEGPAVQTKASRRAKRTPPRLTTTRVEIPRFSGPAQHVVTAAFLPDDQLWTTALSPVPAHSPFQAGDWVVCHGYPGEVPGPLKWGWRGFVLGGMGATLLRGLTDDGRQWCEYWGKLWPDGTPCPDGRCVCHPCHPKWFADPEPERPEQLELFALAGMFGGGR
ncbi:hypothetical protein E1211_15300 [Micromonospora sp. 15K316]|uniref:hypothetical protein n=1 Tax=Micromonospora sp. 15K316 TaxID=2530376 RepID=UPI001051D8B3|nr:hypothetical protein [Micromonospora sp. 15K316]TDC35670.1 hypothetical protein E1211_15300 [Micromonospora sp. 15K316]